MFSIAIEWVSEWVYACVCACVCVWLCLSLEQLERNFPRFHFFLSLLIAFFFCCYTGPFKPINFKLYIKIDITEQTYNFLLVDNEKQHPPPQKYAYHLQWIFCLFISFYLYLSIALYFNSFWVVLYLCFHIIFVGSHMRKLRISFGLTTIAIVIENNNEWQLHSINTSFYIWHIIDSTYLCRAKPFHPSIYTYIDTNMHIHTHAISSSTILLSTHAGKQRHHSYVWPNVCALPLPKLSKIAHLSDPEATIKIQWKKKKKKIPLLKHFSSA